METKKSFVPGIIITVLGIFMLILSIKIRNNPVQVENVVINFMTEARFLPLVVSVVTIILGIIFTIQLANGKATCTSGMPKEMLTRVGILTAMTVVYLVLVTKINFLIPTILYIAGMLFYMNWGKKKWWVLLIITAAYTVIALIVTPYILQMNIKLI